MFWESRTVDVDSNTFLVLDQKALSYEQVFDEADRLFSKCERSLVLFLCDRNIETILGYVGALRNGLIPLMLDEGMKVSALDSYISTYAPRYIFSPTRENEFQGYSPAQSYKTYTLYECTAGDQIELADELSLLLPTSGSTGDPKSVRLSVQNIDCCTRSVCDYLEIGDGRRAISLLPFHYSYGLSVLHNTMQSRSSIVITKRSVLEREFWSLMEETRVTDFSAVPFVYEAIRRMKIPGAVWQNLVCMTQAGGRLDPKLTELFFSQCSENDVKYYTMYGQTEAGPRISYVPPERAIEKLGSVGVSISCGEAFIAESQSKSGIGELLYRGKNVCLGYAYSKEDLNSGDVLGGELHTDDQVSIDEDGFITVLGRRKRFIKLQGLSINLDYIESILNQIGARCAVIGEENRLVVVYTASDPQRIDECISTNFNFHRSNVKKVEVDELPITSSGKCDYRMLSALYL